MKKTNCEISKSSHTDMIKNYDLNFQKMSLVMILIIQLKKNQRMIKMTKMTVRIGIHLQIHQTKIKLSSVNFATKLFNITQLEKPI